MDASERRILARSGGILRVLTGVAGGLLTLYVTLALFGFVRSSSQHYAAFTFAVMLMSGLISVRTILGQRLLDPASRWFRTRLGAALLGFVLATAGGLYILYHAKRLEVAAPYFDNVDMTVGLLFTAGVLILTWLHWGAILTFVIAASIAYFFYGHLLSHPLLTHPEYQPNFVMNYVGLGTTQGFFWFAQTAVDDIYYLVLYASVLFGIGMLHSIIEMGKAMGNRIPGGAAGPAVIGSGVVSMVMGVAVSNVVLTGRFTIPMMKKYGYSPAMAGAIEAAASTSGQIMPPVLGLAAFIIASFLSMKYIDVVKAAVIPGLLYMTGIAIAVMVYARRHRLPKLHEVVDTGIIWRTFPAFFISFVAVCWLLIDYYSPSVAGLAGCLIALALSLLQGRYRPGLRQLALALEEGLELMAVLALLLIAIGPLGQAFLTTNLSGRLGTYLVHVLPDNSFILLAGAAVLSLILGMGLPTPVAYLVVALALVPFLQLLGVKPFLAHYFVFYFAVYSALSPPVAVAALAGAKIAGASFWDTARESMKLAATTFIIPFAFVYRPQLLDFPNLGWNVLPPLVEVLLIQWTSSIALFGYLSRVLSPVERSLFCGVTVLGYWAMITEPIHSTFIFVAAVAALFAIVLLRRPATVSVSTAEGGGP
ncbi:MAG: TRAP transporter fused permease subunit [Betaproteobacteria bacterium]|nr:MAG: TRAP transporter fused permease subunit [Betaproteobacteria bacterium]